MVNVRLESGQLLRYVHPETACEGTPCCIHHPSGHHMAEWPRLWRDDRQLMERTCPHGVGHPDPDHLAYAYRLPDNDGVGVHGCDGCCHTQGDDV